MNVRPFVYNSLMKPIKIQTKELKVTLLDFGARIAKVEFADKNLVLTYDHFDEFITDPFYLGASVGPIANRISGAKLAVENQDYFLPKNEGINCLHSGDKSFSHQYWELAEQSESHAAFKLIYDLAQTGMHGTLTTTVYYRLLNNTLEVEYVNHCNVDCYINTSNHAYFNLSCENHAIDDHEFTLHAQHYLEVDEHGIPTGRKIAIDDQMNFTLNTENAFSNFNQGIDHHFNVIENNDRDLKLMLQARSKTSGVSLTVNSTSPGYQFYTAKNLTAPFAKSAAFCVETQYAPDAINQANLYAPLLKAGCERHQTTQFCFTETEALD